jgi:hypothetical protein
LINGGRNSLSRFVVGPVGAALRGRTPVANTSFNKPGGVSELKSGLLFITWNINNWTEKVIEACLLIQRIHWL